MVPVGIAVGIAVADALVGMGVAIIAMVFKS